MSIKLKINGHTYFTYARRPDLPYELLKAARGDDAARPRFIRLYPDGCWSGHRSKRDDSPAWGHGQVSILIARCPTTGDLYRSANHV